MQEVREIYRKSNSGRFQITFFKCCKVFEAGECHFPDRDDLERVRVCVQFSRFDESSDQWERQQIWCSPQELHHLEFALKGLYR
jgi:hypothetical protein